MTKRPGGEIDKLPLHFIWLADRSSSMRVDGKIQALNQAIREAVPHMRKVSQENPRGRMMVRTLAFGDAARWHQPQPTDVQDYEWRDLRADGRTAMGAAMRKVGEALETAKMPKRALPPVMVLISDGQPTDNFRAGYREMMSRTWAKKAVRMAISIGRDADDAVLRKFIGRGNEVEPLQANNPEALAAQIQWVSTAVVRAASEPGTRLAARSASGSVASEPAASGSAASSGGTQGSAGSAGAPSGVSRAATTGNVPASDLRRDPVSVADLNENDIW